MVGVSVSGYYGWRRRSPSTRSVRHAMLLEVIQQIHRASRRTYGARRIHAELVHGRGLPVARCTVELVMRRNNLAGLPGRHRYRKIPNHPTAADLVDRRFRRDEPDQLWVTDITEHPTREGKIYCAVVLDVFSRRVVGWSIDSRPQASLATNALAMAINNRQPNASTAASTSTSVTPTAPGSAARTRTPTACCANTSLKAPTSPDTAAKTSNPSRSRSMPDHAKPSTGEPQPKPSTNSYTPPSKTVLRRPLEPGQFTSWAFTQRARDAGLAVSMGSIGDCFDNAVIESFWARMQVELELTRFG